MRATRTLQVAMIMAAAALAATVAVAGVDVKTEGDPNTDFTALKTWAINPTSAGNAVRIISPGDDSSDIKQKLQSRVIPIVESAFVKAGYAKAAADTADFYVTTYVLVTAGSSSQAMGQFVSPTPEWGLPYFAPSTTALSVFPLGSMILDITSRATGQVVWRGVAQVELKWEDTEARREQHVRDAVQQLLKKYPPKPAKKK